MFSNTQRRSFYTSYQAPRTIRYDHSPNGKTQLTNVCTYLHFPFPHIDKHVASTEITNCLGVWTLQSPLWSGPSSLGSFQTSIVYILDSAQGLIVYPLGRSEPSTIPVPSTMDSITYRMKMQIRFQHYFRCQRFLILPDRVYTYIFVYHNNSHADEEDFSIIKTLPNILKLL